MSPATAADRRCDVGNVIHSPALILYVRQDGCWSDSAIDRCELALCCILSCRIFLHLCLCLHVIVEYSKYLVTLNPALDTDRQPSVALSALYARHAAQEPFPSLAPPTVRYLAVYASGLCEEQLGRLSDCDWSKPAGGAAQREDEGAVEAGVHEEAKGARAEGQREGEEDGDVCSICLCDFEPGAAVVWLPCTHHFHSLCIRVWLSQRNLCPECRREVLPVASQQHLLVAEGV